MKPRPLPAHRHLAEEPFQTLAFWLSTQSNPHAHQADLAIQKTQTELRPDWLRLAVGIDAGVGWGLAFGDS